MIRAASGLQVLHTLMYGWFPVSESPRQDGRFALPLLLTLNCMLFGVLLVHKLRRKWRNACSVAESVSSLYCFKTLGVLPQARLLDNLIADRLGHPVWKR
jgi:hypothetical protein